MTIGFGMKESDSIPFIFALDYTDQFSVRSCDVYNNSRIILSENKDYEAILSLDLFSAFHSLSSELISGGRNFG